MVIYTIAFRYLIERVYSNEPTCHILFDSVINEVKHALLFALFIC